MTDQNLTRYLNKLARFLLAGLPGFICAIALNYLLVSIIGLYQPLAYALVLVVQVSINFFLCKYFVFRCNSDKSTLHLYWLFLLNILLFRALDWLLYTALVHFWSELYLIIQLGNVVLFSLLKFKSSKRIFEK